MGKQDMLEFGAKSNARAALMAKLAERRNVKVTFLGIDMNCKLHTIKEMERLHKALAGEGEEKDVNRKTVEFLAEQFTDIEDGQPMWTPGELEETLPSKDLQTLLRLFFESNTDDMGKSEKN